MTWHRPFPGVTVIYTMDHQGIEVDHLLVAEEKRGRGFGTRAMRQIQRLAKKVNLPIRLTAAPEDGKKGALNRFYRRIGFRRNHKYPGDFTQFVWKPKTGHDSRLTTHAS